MRRSIILALLLAPSVAFAQSYPATPYSISTSTESSHVLKTGPGSLKTLVVNTAGSAGFVLVYDATAKPSDGTVAPNLCFQIAPSATGSLNQQLAPWPFQNGAVVVFSTGATCYSQTSSATAVFAWQVQ